MGDKNLKIVFWVIALFMLVSLLLISRDAGISGDEPVHYQQSEMVYRYFITGGADKSSLDTPKTHLQYYGQTFDNLVTFAIHLFGIEDIYGFRHLMSSISGWLTIMVTAMFAVYLSGYGAAIFVLLLFAVSPGFLGHTQNNLKDIPFALAYIACVYYSLKLVFSEGRQKLQTVLLLILSIGFAIGIRAGGILMIFYLGFFMFIKIVPEWINKKKTALILLKKYLFLFVLISLSGYLLSLVTWPYGLQNPLINPWKSYQVMTHFPTTVRQIFEGKFDWSDFHPWYYLPKYMAITIPVIVFTGIGIFVLFFRKITNSVMKIPLILVVFTIIFPMLFVILKNSNLYGSWRHFLFVYPAIILIASLGFDAFFIKYRHWWIRILASVLLLILSFHPVKFMAANHPYYYLYYNQFVGGLKGAFGDYETDYYYHSMREGAEWLMEQLKNRPQKGEIIVGGNFPVQWYFRNEKGIKFVYLPYQKRSEYNWDYAIVANSYIAPYQLKNRIWPPQNTIHTIYADGIPICAVIERLTKDDFSGIEAHNKGDNIKSAFYFQKALETDPQNEWICYKFAASLVATDQDSLAEIVIRRCFVINPEFEEAFVLAGDLALKRNDTNKAIALYRKAIEANRKYFGAYIKLAGMYSETNIAMARKILKDCLDLNPKYKPALMELAESYRESEPEIARKYDKIINRIK